jgi:hypothetical protein
LESEKLKIKKLKMKNEKLRVKSRE